MTVLTVAELLDRRGDLLGLDLVAGEAGLDRQITGADISSPGLVLAGFTDRFPVSRSQVLGETEIMYLRSLDGDRRARVLRGLLENDLPCVIVTKGLELPSELISLQAIGWEPALPSTTPRKPSFTCSLSSEWMNSTKFLPMMAWRRRYLSPRPIATAGRSRPSLK